MEKWLKFCPGGTCDNAQILVALDRNVRAPAGRPLRSLVFPLPRRVNDGWQNTYKLLLLSPAFRSKSSIKDIQKSEQSYVWCIPATEGLGPNLNPSSNENQSILPRRLYARGNHDRDRDCRPAGRHCDSELHTRAPSRKPIRASTTCARLMRRSSNGRWITRRASNKPWSSQTSAVILKAH